MNFGIDYLLADLCRYITLLPGDVVLTGTPGNSRPMDVGDIVEVEVDGLGRLTNAVVEVPTPTSGRTGVIPPSAPEAMDLTARKLTIPVQGVPADKLILLRFQNKRLLDATDVFITDARGFGPYNNSGVHTLRISRSEVGVGDSFALEISGFRDAPVELTYTFNEGRVQLFQTILDHQGRAKFDVSEATPKGSYHFLGFKVMGEPDWFRADAAITVR